MRPLATVGGRLRRWFGRPRLTGELWQPGVEESEGEPPQIAEPAEEPLVEPQDSPAPVEQSDHRGAHPQPTTLPVRLEPCREVPIHVDLDPEDLDRGVVLKLEIRVRRSGESSAEDPEEEGQARAA